MSLSMLSVRQFRIVRVVRPYLVLQSRSVMTLQDHKVRSLHNLDVIPS